MKKLIVFFGWLCCAQVLLAQPNYGNATRLLPIDITAHQVVHSGTGTGGTVPNPATAAQWHTGIDDAGHCSDWIYSMAETDQKNIVGTGYSGVGGDCQRTPTIFKLDNIGMLEWAQPITAITGSTSNTGIFTNVIKAPGGIYVAVGYGGSSTEMIITEFDDNGSYIVAPYALLPSVSNIVSGSNPGPGSYTVTMAKALNVILDPNYNSAQHLIVCGLMEMKDGTNTYESAFVTSVDLSTGTPVSGSTYIAGNYYNPGNDGYGLGDNDFLKLVTDASNNVYACGYISASSADDVTNTGLNNSGQSVIQDYGGYVYDKDAWLVKLSTSASTPTLSFVNQWQFNKSNVMVGTAALNSDPNYGSGIYQYQELGPCTARNQWPKYVFPDYSLPNSIVDDGFSPATNPLIALNNVDERCTNMVMSSNGKIALVMTVNNVGNSSSGVNPIYNGGDLLTTTTSPDDYIIGNGTKYDEYRDCDAFLLEIDPTDYTSATFQGMNVSHFSGSDFAVSIIQDKMGRYIIGGSTADTYSGTDPNLPATIADGDGDGENALIVCTDDAHYNNNGSNASNDLWRRSFVAEDSREGENLGADAGNDEDCFCLFCMANTADDGYVIGGNNDNHNPEDNPDDVQADDWSITKFAPVNENMLAQPGATGQYSFFGGSGVPATYTLPTGTTNWPDGTNVVDGSNIGSLIIIPSGATLNIGDGSTYCTLNFASAMNIYDYTQYPDWWGGRTFGAGILVQPGGKLVVNDATLEGIDFPQPSPNTGTDRNMWDGIVVQGNPASGSAPDQGKVTLKNNSVIQDAVFGLYVAENYRTFDITAGAYGTVPGFNANTYRSIYFGYGNDGGGLVQAGTGSAFQNCRYGFTFQGYPGFHNSSAFNDCTFTTDATGMADICLYTDGNGNNLPGNTYGSAWATYGLTLTDNTFTSDPSFPAYEQPIGLVAADAGMTISRSCTLENGLTGACEGTAGLGNRFSNLSIGVLNSDEAGQTGYPVKMTYNTFDNNSTAIAAEDNTDALQISQNKVDVPAYGIGVLLGGCSGYDVSVNNFNKCSSCGSYYGNFGIVINDGDGNAEQVKNNTFNNMYYPSIALGNNDNGNGMGLQWHCNSYNTMTGIGRISAFASPYSPLSTPVAVSNAPGNMANPQGYCVNVSSPAGNQFVSACYNNMRLYFDPSVVQANLGYNSNQSGTVFDPGTCYEEYNGSTVMYQVNYCQSDPTSNVATACPPPTEGGYTPTDARDVKLDIAAVRSVLDTTTDSSAYAFLSAQLQTEIAYIGRYYAFAENFDTGGLWLQHNGLYAQAFPFYIQAGDYTRAAAVYDSLPMKNGNDTLYAYLANFAYNLYSAGNTWLDLDSAGRDTLASLAQYNLAAGYMASVTDSILGTGPLLLPLPFMDSTLAVDSNAADTVIQPESRPAPTLQTTTAAQQANSFTLYPNPTTGTLGVKASQSGVFYLLTILGQQVAQYPIPAGQTEIKLPPGMTPGVYMGSFRPANGAAATEVRIVFENNY